MKLRTYLILLVVAAVLPVVIFAGAVVFMFGSRQLAVQEERVVSRAHALSLAIDRELSGSTRALEALATSAHLKSADLKKFYELSQVILKSQQH